MYRLVEPDDLTAMQDHGIGVVWVVLSEEADHQLTNELGFHVNDVLVPPTQVQLLAASSQR